MVGIPLSQINLDQINGRTVLPLVGDNFKAPVQDSKIMDFSGSVQVEEVPNVANMQGDILYLFPKEAEDFIFFTVTNLAQFKTSLRQYRPTTSLEVCQNLHRISKSKEDESDNNRVSMVQTQIAFSRAGLNFLGEKENVQDKFFDRGSMRWDKEFLGDARDWDSVFDDASLHGVIIVATSNRKLCDQETQKMKNSFGQSMESYVVHGDARPGKDRHNEHFGYRDGISQPALRGLMQPHKGQVQADPGVIIMGYKGDPNFDTPGLQKRPAWTRDGTIMVFKKLEQFVPEYDEYLKKNGPHWREFTKGEPSPPLSDAEGAALFGARMVGRWKSGAPLDKAPFRDDPSLAEDSEKINDFDYTVQGRPSDLRCPFTAHTRKTSPRNLDPLIQQKFLESSLTMRAGVPYGPEVSDAERKEGQSSPHPDLKRGLLFVCYQACLENGFVRQTRFGDSDYFPITSLVPTKHGQDPIIGGPAPDPIQVVVKGKLQEPIKSNTTITLKVETEKQETVEVSGFTKDTSIKPLSVPMDFFVTSRGGEYFFVPSVSTLQRLASSQG